MKTFSKMNIADIPLEDIHNGGGTRKVLVKPEHVTSSHFEAMTKGWIPSGNCYDWHKHKDADEMFIVLAGKGKFYWEKEVSEYIVGDIITTPANTMHKITAEGIGDSEFYFVRVKV